MTDKCKGLLGLMRRANALAVGEDSTGDAVRAGKAKLLLIAADASDNARKRAMGYLTGRNAIPVELPYTKEEISAAVGTGGCSMAAVTDMGFANALMELLAQAQPDKYSAIAEETAKRCDKAKRRKRETAAERNKRNGKRRNGV